MFSNRKEHILWTVTLLDRPWFLILQSVSRSTCDLQHLCYSSAAASVPISERLLVQVSFWGIAFLLLSHFYFKSFSPCYIHIDMQCYVTFWYDSYISDPTRLRSLGERKDMDITIDGFHSWMWKVIIIFIFLSLSSLNVLWWHYQLPIPFMDVEVDCHCHLIPCQKSHDLQHLMMISKASQLNHPIITMIQGLVWLLPFLYFGYLFEIYNAYALYFIYLQVRIEWITGFLLISVQFPDATWHVAAMSILFLMLGLGNIDIIVWHVMPIKLSSTNLPTSGNLITVSMTIPKKLKDRTHSLLKYRFTRSTSSSNYILTTSELSCWFVFDIWTIRLYHINHISDWTSTSGHIEGVGTQTDRFVASCVVERDNDYWSSPPP